MVSETMDEKFEKERDRQRSKEWYWKNRERSLKRHREWYMRNRELVLERTREWHWRTREIRLQLKRKYYQENKEHILEHNKEMRRTHPERLREYRTKVKLEVLSHYSEGIRCIRCEYDDLRALSIDHVNNDGWKLRDTDGGGNTFWLRLRKRGYPEGYQVLCMNCQFIKHREYVEEQMTDRLHL